MTTPEFFGLSSPWDMLSKARRELEKTRLDLGVDNIFNLFVTLYHVMDYVRQGESIGQVAIESMYADEDFRQCQFICNKGKHLVLRSGDRRTSVVTKPGALFGQAMFGEVMFGEGPSTDFYVDGLPLDPVELAERLILKWEVFLDRQGISR
jgi:hypothetical protein